MRNIRQALHDNPGLSGNEVFAHDTVIAFLQRLQPQRIFDRVGGYGVVAYWGTDETLPTVALRADMDALPIGHRCGHDGHTTILLRVAQLIHEQPITDRGILLVFQPEEETGYGSQKILDSGVLEPYDIRCFLGCHNIPGFPLHQLILADTTFAAASTGVCYHLHGRATHASTPELGINPGRAVAEIIEQILNLGHPGNDILSFRQTTLISIRLGEKTFGTSAGDADICFTLRAFSNTTMHNLVGQADAIVEHTAKKSQLQFSREFVEPFHATVNHTAVVEQLRQISQVDGVEAVTVGQPFRWSEDFANYLLRYPGAFFGIGAGTDHRELHHPCYEFPDELIEPTARLFYRFSSQIKI